MPPISRFLLLDEPLAIDLVNTCVLRHGTKMDLLESPNALSAWLRAERRHITWTGAVDTADLDRVRALRDALDYLLRAHLQRKRPARATLECVNRALALPAPRLHLAWTRIGLALTPPPAGSQRDALLRLLATSAITLLTGPEAARVRECAHLDCRLLFIARNPRRRWCSSSGCGNRARVARHYQRERRWAA